MDSETAIGNRDDVGRAEAGKSAEKVSDNIQGARLLSFVWKGNINKESYKTRNIEVIAHKGILLIS